uniref:Uncharacterized protein n=1 Tax=candidate division CPR3 bacterium TaxID=2268181 RepID=A0A7C5USP0_UNCC3
MENEKKYSFLSLVGEGLIVVLLVFLFVMPFFVADLLTPGYREEYDTAQNRPEPLNTISEESVEGNQTVLGTHSFVAKEKVTMLVPKTLKHAILESYTSSDTEGHFKYKFVSAKEDMVLKVKNETSSRKGLEVLILGDWKGELYIGGQLYHEGFVFYLDPQEDVFITAKPASLEELELEVAVL